MSAQLAQAENKTTENLHAGVPTLTAKQSPLVQSLLANKEKLLQAVQVLPEGHIHVVLPQQMKQNIAEMRQIFGEYGIEPRIFVSHKPSKSNALIKQARAENTGLDVSSKNELISALKNGFSGQNICCTGSKNDDYITLSIQHGCLHSVDSIEELERYIKACEKIAPQEKRNVLLRINSADAPYGGKISRFGIPMCDLEACYNLLKENPNVNLDGFHMHSGESDGDLRAEELDFLLTLFKDAYEQGFSPKTIDVGGSLLKNIYEKIEECEAFVDHLSDALKNNKETYTWRRYGYSMAAGNQNRVSGREGLMGFFKLDDYGPCVKKMMNVQTLYSRTSHQTLLECVFTLALEPGVSAYDQCGIILFKIVDTRFNNKGEHMTVLDGNVFNLSFNITEQMADPVLLTEDEDASETFSTYLVGNLCADFDIMVKRKVVLKGKPKAGDYLCFINTAGYTADFHDAPVHQHPMGQKIVAISAQDGWRFMSEDRFNPYLIEEGSIL